MAATEGVDEDEHGLAGGLLYTAMQFGTALGLSAVTAVSVATGSGPDALRTALVVPVAAQEAPRAEPLQRDVTH